MFFSIFRRTILVLVFSLIFTIAAPLAFYAQDDDDTATAIAFFNQGQDAHEKGELKTAVELYQKAIGIFPEFPEAEYQLGVAFLALDQTDNAEKAFRRALELREDWSLPLTNLGSLLVQKNEFPEAEKLLLKAIELDELNSAAIVALTDLRIKTKASPDVLRQILTKLQNITSKVNATAAAWSARAAVERILGDKTAAKASLNRSLALEPNNKSALAERIELAFLENDLTGALENAKFLSKIAPDNSYFKFLLARAFAENGETNESLKILDSIANPSADVKALRATITANSTVMAAELEKQLAADAKNASVLGRLCALLRTENPVKALEYCRRASEVEPNNLNYVIGYGGALVQAKQFEPAVGLFRRIIEIAPDNYTAHANLGISLFQLKRLEESKKEFLWLAEKQPETAVTYYFLGIIHDQLSEYPDAMAYYQQFLKLADAEKSKLEIDKVNLRLPSLQKQIKEKKGKR